MAGSGEVRIPVSLDTEEASRQLEILKGGLTKTAGTFKEAMGSVYRGITREFKTRTEEVAQGVLATVGTKIQQKLGIAGLTDSTQSRLNAIQQTKQDIGGIAAGRMSEAQLSNYMRTMARLSRQEIEGQRRIDQIGADFVQEDTEGLAKVGAAVGISKLGDVIVGALEKGFNMLFDKVLGKFGLSSGGR